MTRSTADLMPQLADEVLFDNGTFLLLGGGPPDCPNYELVHKDQATISFFPTGSRESQAIIRQIRFWLKFQPDELSVVEFLAQYAGLNPAPLRVQ